MNKPLPQATPNELAYLDFKKYAYTNKSAIKKELIPNKNDTAKMSMILSSLWLKWAYENNKNFSHILDKKKFGRALMLLMANDNLIFIKVGNKISNIQEALQKDGHLYNVEEVGELYAMGRGGIPMSKAYVGKDGILGNNGTFISWSEIKKFMMKYS